MSARLAGILIMVVGVGLFGGGWSALTAAQDEQPTGGEDQARFVAFDVIIETGAAALAVYQVAIEDRSGRAQLVGVEGGDVAAFAEPPHYDPRALMEERIIIGAFSTQSAAELPAGRTRIATLHVRIPPGGEPDWHTTLDVCATEGGDAIDGTVTLQQREDTES